MTRIRTIPPGVPTYIYAFVSNGLFIETIREKRIIPAADQPSRKVASEKMDQTFPLTPRGAQAASDWCGDMNRAEGERVGVWVEVAS